MRLSDFVLVWPSDAKRKYGSEGKTEAINKCIYIYIYSRYI